jgi:methyl-accepting chemotaxis protein
MIFAGKDTDASAASGKELGRLSAAWSTTLEGIAAELGMISGTTEDEFLAIGARLNDFHQRGCGISALATDMVGEVAGDHVTSAIEELGQMLDSMGRYVGRAQNEIDASAQTLREILGLLDEVSGPLSGFKKVNKVLRMLGISTKIESARLGQSAAGFDTLASDVGDLSVQVNDKAAIILNRKDELTRTIGQTLTGMLDSGARQHNQVMTVLDKTRASLEALTAINARCSSSVAGVSQVSEEVLRNIGEVVMSMQAHDIVRQQIECVERTLKELQGKFSTGQAGADDAVCICDLQSAQLRHAGGELDQAARTIIESLREVARKQSGLSAQTSGMAGVADQAGSSFFSEMEKDISVVSDALLESTKVNRSLCVAMGAVVDTVGEIATFVGDIEKIGEEIKLIALNAQIKSAYTGEEGAALGVLAEAIQRLSIDAIDHTGAVSGTLQAIIAVTQRLNEGVVCETSGLETEVHDMVARLSALLDVLRQVNETLRRSLCRMDDQVAQLSTDIEQVTAGITVHQKVARVLDRAVEQLSGISRDARQFAPGAGTGMNLDEIASRYTMLSQRKIHQSHLVGAPLVEQKSVPAADDGLGDNIEFF